MLGFIIYQGVQDQQRFSETTVKVVENASIFITHNSTPTEADVNWVIARFIGFVGFIIGIGLIVWYAIGGFMELKQNKIKKENDQFWDMPVVGAERIGTGTINADQLTIFDMRGDQK